MGTHKCGGTIAKGYLDGVWCYEYCDRCSAFAFGDIAEDAEVPNGTDREANRAAWDLGHECSPTVRIVAR